MILENVSGDFSIQINQRYSLVMIPSMAFVAALPVAHLVKQTIDSMSGKDAKQNALTSILVTLVAAALFAGWTFHYKEDFNKNIMYNRNHLTIEEHEILGWLAEQPKKERLFIYGRPWHFIGYGISSIHYDRARKMSADELNTLINKYNGEVYYIRGLDCWDSHTYHKKAVEHRIATTCDIFERDMDLVGIKNILITNNYWVQIAKFNGRKSYNPEKIISISEFEETPADSLQQKPAGLKIGYELKERGQASDNWKISIFVNKNIIKMDDYKFGTYDREIGDLLQPGFNQIRFIIQDKNSHANLADISKFYFEKASGATPLVDIAIESHNQEWGKMHKNESIEGHKFNINGQNFLNGFGIHASSTTVFDIDKKFSTLRFSTGLDDESLCSEGVAVEVLGDGVSLAKTPFFKNGQLQEIEANVSGVQKLTLKTMPLKGIDCAHVDIINPVLIP